MSRWKTWEQTAISLACIESYRHQALDRVEFRETARIFADINPDLDLLLMPFYGLATEIEVPCSTMDFLASVSDGVHLPPSLASNVTPCIVGRHA